MTALSMGAPARLPLRSGGPPLSAPPRFPICARGSLGSDGAPALAGKCSGR
jgi:hypothetical protein